MKELYLGKAIGSGTFAVRPDGKAYGKLSMTLIPVEVKEEISCVVPTEVDMFFEVNEFGEPHGITIRF
jgi:hypothetical protein